jgi:hypothetical protein
MMMKVFVILKNSNFKYSGDLLSENESSITINDFKLGKIEISKDTIAIRGVQ